MKHLEPFYMFMHVFFGGTALFLGWSVYIIIQGFDEFGYTFGSFVCGLVLWVVVYLIAEVVTWRTYKNDYFGYESWLTRIIDRFRHKPVKILNDRSH